MISRFERVVRVFRELFMEIVVNPVSIEEDVHDDGTARKGKISRWSRDRMKIIQVPRGPFAKITSLAEVLNLLRYLEPYGDSPWITTVNGRKAA